MTAAHRARVLAIASFATLTLSPSAIAQTAADVVIEWNRLLYATVAIPGANPPTVFSTRPAAIMHVAIFDALNSIDYLYEEYAVRASATPTASREAAAAQAGHDVLAALFPNQRPLFDAALAATLERVPAEPARDGARTGAEAAAAILELRRTDGWNRVPPPYLLPGMAGYWQPVPPQNAPAAFTHYPDVDGFIYASARRMTVEAPPPLTTARYAADFNEAKALGAAGSAIRTADQTLVARLWAGIGTTTSALAIWNVLVRDLVRSRGLDGLQAARIFALLNMTTHDALRGSFASKYLYGLWRPTTAIREAGRDGNDATDEDPTWTALIATPPYPTYPGNMACLGGSQAQLLARIFGRDDIPFSLTWSTADGSGITRPYNGFRELADEEANSRIYGGIHFRFDTTASFGVCVPLADYAFDNYLRPRFPGR